jgi:hypothetical protein
VLALRADSADQEKNIGQALVMSGTMMSSPGVTELIVHEQQREPKLAAGVVDTGRATAGVSELP